jgi:hypothetical protein
MMMMSPAPLPPKQSDFYNIVCGGTWLNRSQFSQAQADFRVADGQAKSEQLSQQSRDWYQQTEGLNPFSAAFTANRVSNALNARPVPVTVPQASPFVDEARGFYRRVAENIEQIRTATNTALLKTAELPKILSQGFLALFAVAFLSGRKNTATSTGDAKSDDQKAILKEAEDLREMPKIFNTNKVQATSNTGGAS